MLISLNLLEGRYFRFLQYFSASVEVLRVSHSFSLPLPPLCLSHSYFSHWPGDPAVLTAVAIPHNPHIKVGLWSRHSGGGWVSTEEHSHNNRGWDCVCCGLSMVWDTLLVGLSVSIVQTGLKLLVSPGFWCSSRLPSSSSNNFLCSNLSTLFCVLTIRSQSIT